MAVQRCPIAVSCVLLALLIVVSGCSTHSVRAPIGERQTRPLAGDKAEVHIVRRGESLFSIAWQRGLDYHALAAWNGIRPPYTIYPGQRLRLRPPPQTRSAGATRAPPVSTGQRPPAAAVHREKPPAVATRSVPSASGPVQWIWPAKGPLLRRFDADGSGKKGILVGGAAGSDVRAAAAGQVVYAGSGLVGYGQLIIIQHNNTYLSAYGHNRVLLVKEGEVVRSGQVIAQMGSSGTNQTQLHFEIRRNGKSVDPLRYLPRR